MISRFGQLVGRFVGDAGWDQMVSSMRSAIEDRSHVTNLGYAICFVLIVWIHWRVVRWVFRQFESPTSQK